MALYFFQPYIRELHAFGKDAMKHTGFAAFKERCENLTAQGIDLRANEFDVTPAKAGAQCTRFRLPPA